MYFSRRRTAPVWKCSLVFGITEGIIRGSSRKCDSHRWNNGRNNFRFGLDGQSAKRGSADALPCGEFSPRFACIFVSVLGPGSGMIFHDRCCSITVESEEPGEIPVCSARLSFGCEFSIFLRLASSRSRVQCRVRGVGRFYAAAYRFSER